MQTQPARCLRSSTAPRRRRRCVASSHTTDFQTNYHQVSEIVDRAQKEEKMEGGLKKLEETWGRVAFTFAPHKEGSDVALVKIADEDFEVRACVGGVVGGGEGG